MVTVTVTVTTWTTATVTSTTKAMRQPVHIPKQKSVCTAETPGMAKLKLIHMSMTTWPQPLTDMAT